MRRFFRCMDTEVSRKSTYRVTWTVCFIWRLALALWLDQGGNWIFFWTSNVNTENVILRNISGQNLSRFTSRDTRFTRVTSCALHTVEYKNLHIEPVLCWNFRTTAFILPKTAMKTQLVTSQIVSARIRDFHQVQKTVQVKSELFWLHTHMWLLITH